MPCKVAVIRKRAIQVKATKKTFPILFIILYKVVLCFESVDEILECEHSNETTELFFHVVLFIMLYKVVLTFETVDEIRECDHSNEATEQFFHLVLFIMLYKVWDKC